MSSKPCLRIHHPRLLICIMDLLLTFLLKEQVITIPSTCQMLCQEVCLSVLSIVLVCKDKDSIPICLLITLCLSLPLPITTTIPINLLLGLSSLPVIMLFHSLLESSCHYPLFPITFSSWSHIHISLQLLFSEEIFLCNLIYNRYLLNEPHENILV